MNYPPLASSHCIELMVGDFCLPSLLEAKWDKRQLKSRFGRTAGAKADCGQRAVMLLLSRGHQGPSQLPSPGAWS